MRQNWLRSNEYTLIFNVTHKKQAFRAPYNFRFTQSDVVELHSIVVMHGCKCGYTRANKRIGNEITDQKQGLTNQKHYEESPLRLNSLSATSAVIYLEHIYWPYQRPSSLSPFSLYVTTTNARRITTRPLSFVDFSGI